MNHSGDAAEQIVRMSLEGVEVAAKITGTAAKEVALLLLAALKSPDRGGKTKTRGRERLNAMLKSGKPLEIFSVRERDLRTFAREAKSYGIVYCVLRSSKQSPDGLCDILVKADDAPKINRLVERFEFAAVDRASIESEVLRDMAAQGGKAAAGQSVPEINNADGPAGGLAGTDEGRPAPDTVQNADATVKNNRDAGNMPDPPKTESEQPAPVRAPRGRRNDAAAPTAMGGDAPLADGGLSRPDSRQPPRENQSGRSSGSRGTYGNPILSKPSVKEELREITADKKSKDSETARREDIPSPVRPAENAATTHKQPKINNKQKSGKSR